MRIEIGFFLVVILFSRLFFTFRDVPLKKSSWIWMSLIQIAACALYEFSWLLLGLAVFMLLVNIYFYGLEQNKERINQTRILMFLVQLLGISVFFGSGLNLRLNAAVFAWLNDLGRYSVLIAWLAGIDWESVLPVLTGLLLVTNEANILIRFLFSRFDLAPNMNKTKEKNLVQVVGKREYNAGRVIGILERVFVYYFVLSGQLAAIGFIIAAKSFARFKDLDKREFAEYVLIGTLLSALIAMLVGALVKFILL